MSRKNWTGIKVGRLTIMEYEPASSSGDRYSRYVCKCDCQEIVKVITADLASGNTQSCGCLTKETLAKMITTRERRRQPKVDLTERRFGKLVIRGLTSYSATILWNCKCDCGNIIDLTTQQLTRIDSPKRSCGCKRVQGNTRAGINPPKAKSRSRYPTDAISMSEQRTKSIPVDQTEFVSSKELTDEQKDYLIQEHTRIINSIELGMGIWSDIGIFAEWRDFGKFARWVENNLPPVVVGTKLTRVSRYNDFQPGNVRWSN